MFETPFYHLIFCRPLKVVYAPIPKAACSSWKVYLQHEMGIRNASQDGERIHSRYRNGFLYANMIEREDLIRILFAEQGGYFKFTVCRNPFSRLIAAYTDLVKPRDRLPPRGGRAVEALRMAFCSNFDKKPSAVPFLSFDQFIRAIGSSDPATFDRHWQLQSVLACVNLIRYDVTLKMEEMGMGSPALISKMGRQTAMNFHLNQSAVIDETLRFSPKMREIVRNVYARDFKRFKYDVEDVR